MREKTPCSHWPANFISFQWSYGVLLWELMTRGYQPYADIQNSQMKKYILNGHRLNKPEFIPDEM